MKSVVKTDESTTCELFIDMYDMSLCVNKRRDNCICFQPMAMYDKVCVCVYII